MQLQQIQSPGLSINDFLFLLYFLKSLYFSPLSLKKVLFVNVGEMELANIGELSTSLLAIDSEKIKLFPLVKEFCWLNILLFPLPHLLHLILTIIKK